MRKGIQVFVVLLLGVTACSSGSNGEPGRLVLAKQQGPQDLARAAYERLVASGSGGRFTETRTYRHGRSTYTQTIDGEFDLRSGRTSATVRYRVDGGPPQRPPAITPVVHRQAAGSAPGELDVRLIRDGNDLYVTRPAWQGDMAGKWLRFDGMKSADRESLPRAWNLPSDLFELVPSRLIGVAGSAASSRRFLAAPAGSDSFELTAPGYAALDLVLHAETRARLARERRINGDHHVRDSIPVRVDLGADGHIRRIQADVTPLSFELLQPGPRKALRAAGHLDRYELQLRDLGTPVRIAPPTEADQRPGTVEWARVRSGTCAPDGVDLAADSPLPVTGCSEPHRYEVFTRVRLGGAGDRYPGQTTVAARADERCRQAYRRHVRRPGGDGPRSSYWYHWPGTTDWERGVRDGACVVEFARPVTTRRA